MTFEEKIEFIRQNSFTGLKQMVCDATNEIGHSTIYKSLNNLDEAKGTRKGIAVINLAYDLIKKEQGE